MITIIIEKRIGLDYAQKLYAIYRDNVSNNDTFYNHLYTRLCKDYNNDPLFISGLLKCRFCRQDSWIHYTVYIITLVVSAVLSQLKAGTYKEAIEFIALVKAIRGVFTPEQYSALSIYKKIQGFVL